MGSWNRRRQKPDYIEYDPDKKYTKAEMEIIADQFLREDSNRIVCTCPEDVPEDHDCPGKRRGIKGEDPILFYDHIRQRRRREILSASGTVDPSIVSGVYWRPVAGGRKVNSKEARDRGAAYYSD